MRPKFNPDEGAKSEENKKVSLEYLFDNFDSLFVWKIMMPKYSLHGRPCKPTAVFKALVLKEMMQISSKRKLAMFLRNNKFWRTKLGFDEPPDHSTFTNFIKRVGSDAFEQILDHLVNKIRETRTIGKSIAVDSTLIKAYARSYKDDISVDPDAVWGINPNNEGWVFGYKLHLIVDTDLELPLTFTITPANVYDGTEYPNLIQKLIKKGIKPEVVIADAGYDSKKNYFLSLAEEITPVIALNPRKMQNKKIREFETILPIQRNTLYWSQMYSERSSVERVISRLKEELNLKAVKVRGINNVKVHVTLSLITMLIVAYVALTTGNGALSTSVNSFKF